jgi:hypothetical protein
MKIENITGLLSRENYILALPGKTVNDRTFP